jgi:lysozyme
MMDFPSSLLVCLEGLHLQAYQDSGGIWTIACGHTKGVKKGDSCTYQQALEWLREDQTPLYSQIASLDHLSQAAYISFGYNCGIGSLIGVLNGSGSISNPIHTTDRHGTVLPGLVARRNLEISLLSLAQQLKLTKEQ